LADLIGYYWSSDFSMSMEELGIERTILTETYKRREAKPQQQGFVRGPVPDAKPQANTLRKLPEVRCPAPLHCSGFYQPLR